MCENEKSEKGLWKGSLKEKYSACKYQTLYTWLLDGSVTWSIKNRNIKQEEFAFYIFKAKGFPKLPEHFLQGLHRRQLLQVN